MWMVRLSRVLVTGGAGFIGSHLVDRLMDMAAQGFNPQQIFDSGKLPGRTLRAIGKQAYCSIVRTFPTAKVHTIDEFSNRFVGVWLNMTGVYCCCFFRRYFVFLRVCT